MDAEGNRKTEGRIEASVWMEQDGLHGEIENKTEYRLTHLLEFGHAIRRGGRKIGDARAFEHIAPVAKKAEENLTKNIIKRVENG